MNGDCDDFDIFDLDCTEPPDHNTLSLELEYTRLLSTSDRIALARQRRQIQLRAQAIREANAVRFNSNKFRKNNFTSGSRNKRFVSFPSWLILLEAASRNDHMELKQLLANNVSPDSRNEDGLTALHQCCIDDSEDIMRLLIEHGADPNACDSEKWTPLHAAATCGHLHLIKYLIEQGAELLAVNADGNMPYDLCEDETALSYIENEMAKLGITQELIDVTRAATEDRMLEDMKLIASEGGVLDYINHQGATPLHIASANGYIEVVDFLLENDVCVDAQDFDLWQALHAAACWGHMEIVEMLVANGADINAKTSNGETPLDVCEDPEIRSRLMQLREIRARLLIRRQQRNGDRLSSSIRRVRSSSTRCSSINQSARTQSIRRTSLRDKIRTTKKAVTDESRNLPFYLGIESGVLHHGELAKIDGEDGLQTCSLPPLLPSHHGSQSQPNNSVDINNIKLTLSSNDKESHSPPNFVIGQPESSPVNSKASSPPENNISENNSGSLHKQINTSDINIHVSVTISSKDHPLNNSHSSSPLYADGTTLSDLKKRRRSLGTKTSALVAVDPVSGTNTAQNDFEDHETAIVRSEEITNKGKTATSVFPPFRLKKSGRRKSKLSLNDSKVHNALAIEYLNGENNGKPMFPCCILI